MSEITPDVVAAFLTGADNDFAEDLDGWPGLHSEGNVLHITVTPAKETSYGSTADEDNKVHFRAVVVKVPVYALAAEAVHLPAEMARELAYGYAGDDIDDWTVAANDYVGTTRWSSTHRLVIRNEAGEHFVSTYRKGLTESQHTQPYEGDVPVEFTPVVPQFKVVTEWVPAEAAQADQGGGQS